MKIFIEEQRFTQIWLHLILIISFLIPFVMVTYEWLQSEGKRKDVEIGFYVLVGTLLLVYGIVLSLRLRTRIDEKGIYFRFSPFHLSDRYIPWRDIERAYIRKYFPLSEYGGWGIRTGMFRRKGRAVNVKGNIGLQLELKNGKKLLIGTQKEFEIKKVLETYHNKINNEA